MKLSLAVLTLALIGMLSPVAAGAADQAADQAAAPAATNTFTDPAMTFTAPPDFRRVPMPPHDPMQFENKAVVAAFVKGAGTNKVVTITITMQNFDGSANGFATSSDNDLRGATDGVFIKQTQTKLANGMPAVFETVTLGSGFGQMEAFRYLWADGVRGIELSEMARYGTTNAKQALADMASATGVAYPRNRY